MNERTEGGGSRSDWNEYSKLVLNELQRNADQFEKMNEKIERIRGDDLSQLKADITLLKFQAALWGAFGGLLFTGIITIGVRFLK